jgi:glutamate-1-semialdehyde 2,1-aminomutase
MGEKSRVLFEKAKKYIPGGVNSPVRAGQAVGIDPPFISKANGCVIWDVDGNEYVDYVCSWGPMILGHAHPEIVNALEERVKLGTSYGAPTELEVEMADIIVEMVPSIEMVRMVNSGTEATSPGVPQDLARHTISLPYNSLESVVQAFGKFGPEIAAVIVEPIPGNMGVINPDQAFLKGLRELTNEYGALLIFDEVISGFRVAPGGAQELYDIMPDLTCLGKIIGGGLPVGAYGGKKEIMTRMAPQGDVYQAGTLSGNPLAMAAGLATLKILKEKSPYDELDKLGDMLFSGLKRVAEAAGVNVVINRVGSMGSLFFTDEPVTDFETAKASDENQFKRYFRSMLDQGIYLAPSPYEAAFLSTAHSEETLLKTFECASVAFKSL